MENNEDFNQSEHDENGPDLNLQSETSFADVIGDFLSKFKPKDIKEVIEQFAKYQEAKLALETEYKKQDLILKEAHLRAKAKLAFQYQWIRFVVLLASGSAVTYLIVNKSFDSAPALFFGGVVAYLFGKEPK